MLKKKIKNFKQIKVNQMVKKLKKRLKFAYYKFGVAIYWKILFFSFIVNVMKQGLNEGANLTL